MLLEFLLSLVVYVIKKKKKFLINLQFILYIDERTFLLFCEYWKVELSLQEKHPDQGIIIRKMNNDIVFETDDGTVYRISV